MRYNDQLRQRRAVKLEKLSTLQSAIIWVHMILVSVPWLSWILLSYHYHKKKRGIMMVNSWAHFVLTKILKVKLEVEIPHEYGEPPYVFVLLNQYSLLESLLILPAALPHTDVFAFANLEFLLIPFVGWVIWKVLGAEMVIRQYPKHAHRALDNAIDRMIKYKSSVVISIEGKRPEDGKLSDYKKGAALLGIKTGASIIPIVIEGAKDIWPYGTWRINKGGTCKVRLLEGIVTTGMTLDDRNVLTKRLRDIAEAELYK
eukprot:TRINITY_DN12486_c0_g1_i1.p1 TRINITY_DN12486_c0_g1~~TRINITY_DN12486_c0_g1_i1.p1  ORF type:complete len:295 (-),score=44.83 TRINITY_DN12486_c0_g1_i1:3-776(-)